MVFPGWLARIVTGLMVLGVVVFVTFGSVPGVFAESVLEGIRVRGDTVERVDPDTGERLWEVVHASVWENVERVAQAVRITEPVLVDGYLYYGVQSWLMQVNVATGVIESRLWFPAGIVDVGVAEEGLRVRVELQSDFGDGASHQVVFLYRVGTKSPEEIWQAAGVFGPWRDVTYMAPGLFNPEYKFTADEMEANLAMLRERRAQEVDNPFYDFFIGWLHVQAGDDERAQVAFERAVSTRAVHWTTWLQLTTFFDQMGEHDFADKAFGKTQGLMEQLDWIDVRSWPASIIRVVLMRWSFSAIDEAIRAERLEDADRMLERIAWVFPYTENGPAAWELVAGWYRSHQRADLAEKWDGHAKTAGASAWGVFSESTRRADLAFAVVISLVIASLLSVLVIGIRRGAVGEQRGKISYPGKAELVGMIVCCLLVFVFLFVQKASVEEMGHYASIPFELSMDGWGSPNGRLWVEGLAAGGARDELLAHVVSVAQARENGGYDQGGVLKSEMADRLVMDAIKTDARAKAWRSMGDEVSMHGLRIFVWGVLLVGLFLLGDFLGRRFSGLGTVVRYGVPGGALSAGMLTPFVIAATIFVIGSFTIGMDTILVRMAAPDYSQFFGLGALGGGEGSAVVAYRVVTWVTLVLVLVVHVGTVWWDRERVG